MKAQKQPKNQKVTTLGDSFVAIPKKVLYMLYHPDENIQHIGKVLLALISHAYHATGYRKFRGALYKCQRGEYIGSIRELEQFTGLTRRIVGKVLQILLACGMIECEHLGRGTRIRMVEYIKFLEQFKTQQKVEETEVFAPSDELPTAEQLAQIDAYYKMFNL